MLYVQGELSLIIIRCSRTTGPISEAAASDLFFSSRRSVLEVERHELDHPIVPIILVTQKPIFSQPNADTALRTTETNASSDDFLLRIQKYLEREVCVS